jgi:hypothetical protein
MPKIYGIGTSNFSRFLSHGHWRDDDIWWSQFRNIFCLNQIKLPTTTGIIFTHGFAPKNGVKDDHPIDLVHFQINSCGFEIRCSKIWSLMILFLIQVAMMFHLDVSSIWMFNRFWVKQISSPLSYLLKRIPSQARRSRQLHEKQVEAQNKHSEDGIWKVTPRPHWFFGNRKWWLQ